MSPGVDVSHTDMAHSLRPLRVTWLMQMAQLKDSIGIPPYTWASVLVRASIAAMKHHVQKQVEEERVYSTSKVLFTIEGIQDKNPKQGRILEAGADVEVTEGCCLLACIASLLSLLSNRTLVHQPRDDTTHELTPSPLITN